MISQPGVEYRRRMDLFKRMKSDEEFRALEIAMCRRFPTHFINNWCMTFDPRRAPKHFPFSTYEFQDEAIQWLQDRYKKKEQGLIEKSRDMGATWIVCAWVIWAWIFEQGFIARFGSRKEDLVDDYTLDSIFGKLRYLLQRVPTIFKRTMDKRHDSHMKLLNPHNGNQIVGESMNVGFGRGGRSSVAFLDEFAHVQHSEAVWASVVENTDCLIPLSTPNGKGNQFAWLRHETKIPVLSLHWSRHPLKDKTWYENKKSTMKPWQVGQELDLSYETSKEGKVYTRFDRKWHIAKEVIKFNAAYEQWVSWDFGYAGAMAILFGQITPEGIIQIWQ
ncbi:MAG: hypothetical protein HOO67_00695, partial [Candidatus Peribacteraceae bacterium]|nr:hypothetical protein [Candidatus Peribacteraceae bacterium]